jgi:hypothetical protein
MPSKGPRLFGIHDLEAKTTVLLNKYPLKLLTEDGVWQENPICDP